jgi:hypothetical protein
MENQSQSIVITMNLVWTKIQNPVTGCSILLRLIQIVSMSQSMLLIMWRIKRQDIEAH